MDAVLHSLQRDIGTVLRASPRDSANTLVGGVTGSSQVIAESNNSQHTTASSQHTLLGCGSTRVNHVHALQSIRLIQTGDNITLAGSVRVVLSSHNHVHCGAGIPIQLGTLRNFTASSRTQQLAQRGAQTRQNRLGFRVAKAGVELDNAHAAAGHSQAAEEHAHERGAALSHTSHGRACHLLHDLLHEAFGQPGKRGVGAHTAGVRALIVVKNALEVLSRGQRQNVLTVRNDEEGHLGAVQELFDDHGAASVEASLSVLQCCGAVLGHHNALTCCQAVVLHHVGCAELVQRRLRFSGVRCHVGASSRHGSLFHDLLSESLRTLQLCSSCGGAENIKTRLTQRVRNTGDQGRLRANNDQVGVQFACQGGCLSGVIRINCVDGNILGNAGVAGGAVHLGYLRVAQKRSNNCVFAAAGAQYQNLHSI